MGIVKNRKHLKERTLDENNKDIDYMWIMCAKYLGRHLDRFPANLEGIVLACKAIGIKSTCLADTLITMVKKNAGIEFQQELKDLDFAFWPEKSWGSVSELPKSLKKQIPLSRRGKIQRIVRQNRNSVDSSPSDRDISDYAEIICKMLKKAPAKAARWFDQSLKSLLDESVRMRRCRGKSTIEKNVDSLSRIFNLNEADKALLIFLFIVACHGASQDMFDAELRCTEFEGRKYLLNILNLSNSELLQILEKLRQLGLIEILSDGEINLEDDIVTFIQNAQGKLFTKYFFQKIPKKRLPLSNHFQLQDQIQYVLHLLQCKHHTPKHILLYGAPGTGKTSFAYGIASKVGLPAYEVIDEENNESRMRRRALMACLRMNSVGRQCLIIVDEADNMLNTQGSWFFRGETQDKGWLNRIMEEPDANVIWITNSTAAIEESVLRRFAFSINFKPFNQRQRIQLWENALRNNKLKSCMPHKQIEKLAKKYRASAGTIDLAIQMARETCGQSRNSFIKSVEMALEAALTLQNNGVSISESKSIKVEGYSANGLNVDCDLEDLLSRLKMFDQHLKAHSTAPSNCNLLFHGPPGTGKSALAYHLADHLDREIICKRMSDLQSKWVGQAEKNIAQAFQEAEREEAILIIDEADSILFSRDRADRSWEISFTNEFLTRMEYFQGILICTTNRINDLDEASIRRFNFKIRFDYLDADGNIIFYKKFLAGLIPSPLNNPTLCALRQMKNLAPGDFKNVQVQFRFRNAVNLKHQVLVNALAEESRIKNQNRTRKIGF
jgi:transitional endoplasmic reticulum ATPase